MKISKLVLLLILVLVIAIPLGMVAAKGRPTGGETAGNNLSYPVIWAEGVIKTLPGTPGMTPVLNGAWWYWWGTEGIDPNIVPLSCAPDPDDNALCNDGIPLRATGALPGLLYEVPNSSKPSCRKTRKTYGRPIRPIGAVLPSMSTGSTGVTTSNPSTGTPSRRCAPRWCFSRI